MEEIVRHATPVEVVRDRRSVRVEYRRLRHGWRAVSPDLPDLDVRSRTLADAKRLVREALEGWLDPQVTIVDRVVRSDPQTWTTPPLLLPFQGGGGTSAVSAAGTSTAPLLNIEFVQESA
ncbi:type II toxin-antitoxin system HicB family antitoxin [Planomonospora algeriensis]